jgi:hypothetical protein
MLLQGAQGIRLRVINEAQHPLAQKLTRPDGEILEIGQRWTITDVSCSITTG